MSGKTGALLSPGVYAFEHPADPFPEFVNEENSAKFHAEELGHPLIPATRCIRNSVQLDSPTRLLLVSGSNMSGKSTLLRAAGAPPAFATPLTPPLTNPLRLTPP